MDGSRRRFLAGAAAVGLADCLGGGSDGDGDTSDANAIDTYDVAGSSGGSVPVRPEGEVALLNF